MTLLDDIGGDDSLVALVNRFYDLVETLPEGATQRGECTQRDSEPKWPGDPAVVNATVHMKHTHSQY